MVIYLFAEPTSLFMKVSHWREYNIFERKGMHPQRQSGREVNGVMCSAETGWHTIHQQKSTVSRAPKNHQKPTGLYSF
jgi:hypothetical protein